MNAVEIIDSIRGLNAELVIEGEALVVRGHGEPLPDELHEALQTHKAELLVALGAPREVSILSILGEIRPHLPPALRKQSDASLLALVNWSMLHAWNAAAGKLTPSRRTNDARTPVQPQVDFDQGSLFNGDELGE